MQQRSEPSQSRATLSGAPAPAPPKGERTLSVCSLRSQPAPPKGELFGIFRQVEQNLPLRGRWHGASRDGEGSARLRQAALPPQRRAFAESGAADDYPFRHRLRRCHTPPFVAARHLPPERGKSFLKGRGKCTAGKLFVALYTLVMSLPAWLSLWEGWQSRQALTERAQTSSSLRGNPFRQKQNAQVPKNLCVMAGVVSFELTARGFGDRCSTS